MKSDTGKTQAETTAEKIRTLILDGTFCPGEPLRQETLSAQLNVSRTPLRHALQFLAEDGLVETTGYKGARVAKPDSGVVRDLFEMRLLLEPLALQSAFGRHTKLDFTKAEIALDTARSEQMPSRLSELNWHFHHALYRPSNRQMLIRTIEHLNKASALAAVIANSIIVRPEKSAAEHRDLLQTCRDGDEEGARAILSEHLRRAYQDVQNRSE